MFWEFQGDKTPLLAGKLAQKAIQELNEEKSGKNYSFYAVRLPYGEQMDEEDAIDAIHFIGPTRAATGETLSRFNKGNTKARERMKAQYDLAAYFGCLVIGTDHAAEAITGFFTKFGDGACDIAPLFGLTKGQGKSLLMELGAPNIFIKNCQQRI